MVLWGSGGPKNNTSVLPYLQFKFEYSMYIYLSVSRRDESNGAFNFTQLLLLQFFLN